MPHIHQGTWSAKGKRFAIIVSRWNEFIADKLLEGALDALAKTGADDDAIEIFRCPGAFELTGLARRVAASPASPPRPRWPSALEFSPATASSKPSSARVARLATVALTPPWLPSKWQTS